MLTPVAYSNPFRKIREEILTVIKDAFKNEQLYDTTNPFLFITDANGEPTKDSKVIIADLNTPELKQENPRPVILTTRGAVRFTTTSFNDSIDYGFTAGQTHSKEINYESNINVEVYTRGDVECDDLAYAVGGLLQLHRDHIRSSLQIVKVHDVQISELIISERDSVTALVKCVIAVPYTGAIHVRHTFVKGNYKINTKTNVDMSRVVNQEGPSVELNL